MVWGILGFSVFWMSREDSRYYNAPHSTPFSLDLSLGGCRLAATQDSCYGIRYATGRPHLSEGCVDVENDPRYHPSHQSKTTLILTTSRFTPYHPCTNQNTESITDFTACIVM
jgi:hypothetical protein